MKRCDTCVYRDRSEYDKPCIIYRDNCEFYEKERGDMTREEAIEQLEKAYKECVDLGQTCGKDSVFWKRAEAIKVAIKALEQEPCGDAISRQAVQDYIAKYLSQYLYNDVREAVEVIDEYIGELPPINPQEPIAQERYEDLCEYFSGVEDILKNRDDFKAWLGRVKWHIHKAEELYEKYEQEPCVDAISRKQAIKTIEKFCSPKCVQVCVLTELPSVNPQEPSETIHGSTYGGVSWGGTYKPQEPCGDLISRQVVKDKYRERLVNNLKDDDRGIDLSEYAEEPYKAFCEFMDSISPVNLQEPCEVESIKLQQLYNKGFEDCKQAALDKKELVELEDGQSFYCISPEDVKTLFPVTPQLNMKEVKI